MPIIKKLKTQAALLAFAALLSLGNTASAQNVINDAVCVDTNVGQFCLRMLTEAAPQTVNNFLNYVRDGDYNRTFFHRSVPAFVVQGGGFYAEPIGEAVPADDPVVNEFGISNTRGTVAMAKVAGDPNSATNQWFVNLRDNSANLDQTNGGFTVFAEVVTGMHVVDDIAHLRRANLSSSLGPVFGEVPVLRQDEDGVDAEDLVVVNRIYITDIDPQVEDPNAGFEAVTEYRDERVITPVRVGSNYYRMIFNQQSNSSAYVFTVDLKHIYHWEPTGEPVAYFTSADNTLTIPSVRMGGEILTDVVLSLSNRETLEFTLQSFNRR